MRKILELVSAVALLCLSWCAIEASLCLRAWRDLPTEILSVVNARLIDATSIAEEQMALTRRDAIREIMITRAGLLRRVDSAAVKLDERLSEIQGAVDEVATNAAQTAKTSTALLEDARPGVQAWSKISPALGANALGLVAAAKLTAGQTAQTMREIQRATPDLLASVRISATASQQAAQAAAQTSQNLATITKPGPRWLRYFGLGASLAVPAAQVALPFTVSAVASK